MTATDRFARLVLGAAACFVLAAPLSAQSGLQISYHLGNSRTLDYLAAGNGALGASALEDLAVLAGVERHAVAYHLNWGQPLKNLVIDPPGALTLGGVKSPGYWDTFIGGQYEINQLVVQPFWQFDGMLGADGLTYFEPATLQSDVDTIALWLSLVPDEDDTRLFIAGVSPTLAYGTFDDNGALANPNDDWLANSGWDDPFDEAADDRVVLTAAYYDKLFGEVSAITDREVAVVPWGGSSASSTAAASTCSPSKTTTCTSTRRASWSRASRPRP